MKTRAEKLVLLRACPFCGGKPEISSYRDWGFHFSPVCCTIINWDKLYKTKKEAVKAWNTRNAE